MNEIKITESALKTILQSEHTTPEELDQYFITVFDDAFEGHLTLRKNVVVIPDVETTEELDISGIIISLANKWARNSRKKKYLARLAEEPGIVRLLSEGDSWFEHPHPKVLDIIDQLFNHYAIYCIGAAGDTLRNMFQEGEFMKAIRDEKPRIFLLSGGGNDILGASFRLYLEDTFDPAPPGENPQRFLKGNFLRELESVGKIYQTVFEKLKDHPVDIIIHGYDYVIPLNVTDSGWVGRYMIEKGIHHAQDRSAIIHFMIDHFNDTLAAVTSPYPKVHYIDLRNTVRSDQWFDEIHPTSDGFQDIALAYHALIQKIILST